MQTNGMLYPTFLNLCRNKRQSIRIAMLLPAYLAGSIILLGIYCKTLDLSYCYTLLTLLRHSLTTISCKYLRVRG